MQVIDCYSAPRLPVPFFSSRVATWLCVLFAEYAAITLITFCFTASVSFAQLPFYQGKTITIIQGREPGGTGDLRNRAVTEMLAKHIPGQPTIINTYMPGAGGRRTANHMYRAAPADGLTIGSIGPGFLANAILGATGVNYDINRFIYLGSAVSHENQIFLTNQVLGLDRLDKLQAASGLRMGAQSVGHSGYIDVRVFAWLLDLKAPRFVVGIPGAELNLALERGEIDARSYNPVSLVQRNPEWIEKNLMDFHVVLEIPEGVRLQRHPAFDSLPSLSRFIRTEIERKVLAMFSGFKLIGSPYILPPDTPREQAQILREAFRKVFSDPEFLKLWKKLVGDDATPVLPAEQQRNVEEIPRDPEVVRLFKALAAAGPLPAR